MISGIGNSVYKNLLATFSHPENVFEASVSELMKVDGVRKEIAHRIVKREFVSDPEEELRKIKKQGYAFDDEETELGGRCAAAPVFNDEGSTVAAVSIMGPSTRIRQSDLPSLARMVKRVADGASKQLGYQ